MVIKFKMTDNNFQRYLNSPNENREGSDLDLMQKFDLSYSDVHLLVRSAITAASNEPKTKILASSNSDVAVGAALLTANNEIITGCNFQRASSYAGAISAEDCAVYKALSEGSQIIRALALHTKHIAPKTDKSDATVVN